MQEHKLAGITLLQNDFLQDTAFDVESYLTNEFARSFGKKEEWAFINGDGVNQPYGILHPTNGAEIGVTASAVDSISFDEIIKLFFNLETQTVFWPLSESIRRYPSWTQKSSMSSLTESSYSKQKR